MTGEDYSVARQCQCFSQKFFSLRRAAGKTLTDSKICASIFMIFFRLLQTAGLVHPATKIGKSYDRRFFKQIRQNPRITACRFVEFSLFRQDDWGCFPCLFPKTVLRQSCFVEDPESISGDNDGVALGSRNQIAHGDSGSQRHFQPSNPFNEKAFRVLRGFFNCFDGCAKTGLGSAGLQTRNKYLGASKQNNWQWNRLC